jgi:hypothetical protein
MVKMKRAHKKQLSNLENLAINVAMDKFSTKVKEVIELINEEKNFLLGDH